jgi:hypothetical protein
MLSVKIQPRQNIETTKEITVVEKDYPIEETQDERSELLDSNFPIFCEQCFEDLSSQPVFEDYGYPCKICPICDHFNYQNIEDIENEMEYLNV